MIYLHHGRHHTCTYVGGEISPLHSSLISFSITSMPTCLHCVSHPICQWQSSRSGSIRAKWPCCVWKYQIPYAGDSSVTTTSVQSLWTLHQARYILGHMDWACNTVFIIPISLLQLLKTPIGIHDMHQQTKSDLHSYCHRQQYLLKPPSDTLKYCLSTCPSGCSYNVTDCVSEDLQKC